ncbi:T6SS phospholipase effector Tle1-like catalytic domain-containing protein [Photorhabdus laumondii]
MTKTKETSVNYAVENTVIRIGVFFDGTGQNANNLLKSQEKDEMLFSNIYRLYTCYDNKASVYVEGVGTKNGEPDKTFPQAIGADNMFFPGYGVSAKYNNAVSGAKEKLKEILSLLDPEKKSNISVKFDLFGFSRGAAIARHFANMLHSRDKSIIEPLNEVVENKKGSFSNDSYEVTFLGLFDTVSTIWSYNPFNEPHDSGKTGELKVCIKKGVAKDAFQITAMHECRYNFPLYSIDGIYPELELPGAHSDIGGSYPRKTNECSEVTDTLYTTLNITSGDRVKKEIAELRKKVKWKYLLSNTEVKSSFASVRSQGIINREVLGDLQYVALMVMYKVALDKGCPLSGSESFEEKIPESLKNYYKEAMKAKDEILAGRKGFDQSKITNAVLDFVHLSASWKPIIPLYETISSDSGDIATEYQQSHEYELADSEEHYKAFDNNNPNRPDEEWVRRIFKSPQSYLN